ncbi:uncharacterized protein LOC144157658 [Haemaphysalis longicornis]
MGVLQPTLHCLLCYQWSLPPLKYCKPLASGLQEPVTKRFSQVLEDTSLALAAAVHPKFKLSWMAEERRAATFHLLEEECRALEASSSENPAAIDRSDEDEFFQLLQASPSSTELQQWVNNPGTSLSELSKFPKIKIFIQRTTGIPSSAPTERLFSRGRDVFGIKRGKLSDSNFEKQLILCYNDVCK